VEIPQIQDDIEDIVDEIWDQFDTDNSGRLNRKETMIFLNIFLAKKGRVSTSKIHFNKIFDDIDLNGDGFISKYEMAPFIRNFIEKKKV
jgi:Ca2+-binding EF-hand superfamily protein